MLKEVKIPRRHPLRQTNVESTCEGTSEEEADGSKVIQRIYRQGLGIFTQDDTVTL